MISKNLSVVAIVGLAIFTTQADSTSSPQQFGFVDLTHSTELSKVPGNSASETLPSGCGKLVPGMIADGKTPPPDGQPRDIAVEVTKLEGANRTIGSEVQAEVQLRNVGALEIQIPWSTDSETIKFGQDPSEHHWDAGTFEFNLRNERGDGILLKSLTAWMYGSEYAARSLLSVPPGGYVSARVKFKLEDEFPSVRQLQPGTWQLTATWEQVRRQWSVANCRVNNGYFGYASYYRQKKPGVTIQILPKGS